uniref:Uncharacterized protein n=1 Tax=Knipowitschia caucasica TaxID=637954 RepID=A0AAV2JKU9_KNICA
MRNVRFGKCIDTNVTVCGLSVCGLTLSACGLSVCGLTLSVCGLSVCGLSVCGLTLSACGLSVCGLSVCGLTLSVCGLSVCGLSVCGFRVCGLSVCGLTLSVCGLTLSVCGLTLSVCGLTLSVCGLTLSVCGLTLSVCGLSVCGLTLSVCGLTFSVCGLSVCSLKIRGPPNVATRPRLSLASLRGLCIVLSSPRPTYLTPHTRSSVLSLSMSLNPRGSSHSCRPLITPALNPFSSPRHTWPCDETGGVSSAPLPPTVSLAYLRLRFLHSVSLALSSILHFSSFSSPLCPLLPPSHPLAFFLLSSFLTPLFSHLSTPPVSPSSPFTPRVPLTSFSPSVHSTGLLQLLYLAARSSSSSPTSRVSSLSLSPLPQSIIPLSLLSPSQSPSPYPPLGVHPTPPLLLVLSDRLFLPLKFSERAFPPPMRPVLLAIPSSLFLFSGSPPSPALLPSLPLIRSLLLPLAQPLCPSLSTTSDASSSLLPTSPPLVSLSLSQLSSHPHTDRDPAPLPLPDCSTLPSSLWFRLLLPPTRLPRSPALPSLFLSSFFPLLIPSLFPSLVLAPFVTPLRTCVVHIPYDLSLPSYAGLTHLVSRSFGVAYFPFLPCLPLPSPLSLSSRPASPLYFLPVVPLSLSPSLFAFSPLSSLSFSFCLSSSPPRLPLASLLLLRLPSRLHPPSGLHPSPSSVPPWSSSPLSLPSVHPGGCRLPGLCPLRSLPRTFSIPGLLSFPHLALLGFSPPPPFLLSPVPRLPLPLSGRSPLSHSLSLLPPISPRSSSSLSQSTHRPSSTGFFSSMLSSGLPSSHSLPTLSLSIILPHPSPPPLPLSLALPGPPFLRPPYLTSQSSRHRHCSSDGPSSPIPTTCHERSVRLLLVLLAHLGHTSLPLDHPPCGPGGEGGGSLLPSLMPSIPPSLSPIPSPLIPPAPPPHSAPPPFPSIPPPVSPAPSLLPPPPPSPPLLLLMSLLVARHGPPASQLRSPPMDVGGGG